MGDAAAGAATNLGAGGGESGGAAAGASGTGGATGGCGPGSELTPEEWAACLAPFSGPHEVSPIGCDDTPIGREYVIVPTISCGLAPDSTMQTPRRLCGVEPGCTRNADCFSRPHGRCVGAAYAFCEYPAFVPGPCESDADCVQFPGAKCAPSVGTPEQLCSPTGDCALSGRICFVPEEHCYVDSDCTVSPGGMCRKVISSNRCEYDDCLMDSDCGPSERCGCHTCVPSTCSSDEDCGSGNSCVLGAGCFLPNGYHCTSSADTCSSGDECPGSPCEYQSDHWACGARCPID
ncbi:MAG TPA: hypothetical protein VHU80_10915 [Polyangiaceae bacterium]|nr:hypothetical protein [Polyangiaceae bacterium]